MLLSLYRNQEFQGTRVPPSYAGKHIKRVEERQVNTLTGGGDVTPMCPPASAKNLPCQALIDTNIRTIHLLQIKQLQARLKLKTSRQTQNSMTESVNPEWGGAGCRAKCPMQDFIQKTYLYPCFCRTAD